MEKQNRQLEHGQPFEQTRGQVLHVRLGCGSLSITTPVSRLANEFDDRGMLHGQVSLTFINQICVIHEAMNDCENLNIQ